MDSGVSKSRLINSKRNVISGITKQLLGMVLTFLIRTVIIYKLGAEYQGLTGLFTAILQVLNLSDLGFSAAVTFILYKPIAENDRESICSIVAFLKRTYFIIGCVITGIGLVLMPFLPHLISGTPPEDINIYILYCIYLFNSAISYWLFAYKSTLLTAMQRADIVSKIYMLSNYGIKVLQLVLLFLFKNYYCFIIVMPVGTIINNIMLQYFSTKLFPEIKAIGKINLNSKRELIKQVKAVFLNRISDIARNSFDDIIVSSILGLTVVTIYDNYYYIFTALVGIMGIIIHSVRASIGNSIVKESVEKNYNDMHDFTFIFMWLAGWCTVCLLCLYQPFMRLWMHGNNDMLLSDFNMILFCIYFYIYCMAQTKGVYLEAKGLFWECRVLYIVEALGNLALNIVLGWLLGVTGIILATIITMLLINFVAGTLILFKYYFTRSPFDFIKKQILYGAVTACVCILTHICCSLVSMNGMLELIVKMIICAVIPNLLFALVYYKSNNFKNSISIIKRLVVHRRG